MNADDFGLSPGVNAGVLEAYLVGIVRSASLVATAPCAEQAAHQAAEVGLELGLHLNLTTGRPACPLEEVPSLVDADGRFHSLGELLLRLAAGRVQPDDLERELEAQVARARLLGVRPSHLNAHHHVHLHPMVGAAALRLAAAHGLPLRCPVEPPRGWHPRDLARGLLLLPPAWRLRRQAQALGIPTAHHFLGISLGYGFDARALAAALLRLPEGLTELMCHPGYPDAELAAATRYTAGRERELVALTDPRVRQALETRGIRLARWSEACAW
ncbi:MAG: ChbG/HpnK family deacetylase [Chloroflexi bacterium]|nr:ChbG/HpnK family deacetylase [Chloroflexota bacterium]